MVNAADGTIAAAYEYDPYGNLLRTDGEYAHDNPFRFSTKYHDEETGLVYYGYRYYAPELGRWVRRDPIGEAGNILLRNESDRKEEDLNLYIFVQNDPNIWIDPLGLSEYLLMWSFEGITDPTGIAGGARIDGTVVALSLDKRCQYPVRDFEGIFPSLSFPIPLSASSYVGLFKDNLAQSYDFNNIEGDSVFITSISIQLGEFGISGPSYAKFGELNKLKMKTVAGIELSAGSYSKGTLRLTGSNNGSLPEEFVKEIIDEYGLK